MSSLSLPISSSVAATARSESDHRLRLLSSSSPTVATSPALHFCGLRTEALKLGANSNRWKVVAAAVAPQNGSASDEFDYNLVIIGAGVGGHGAALHAVEKVACFCFLCLVPYGFLDLYLRIVMRTGFCFWYKKIWRYFLKTIRFGKCFLLSEKYKYLSNLQLSRNEHHDSIQFRKKKNVCRAGRLRSLKVMWLEEHV